MRLRWRRLWFGLLLLPVLLGVWMWRAASWRPKIARVSKSAILALNWSKDGRTLRIVLANGFWKVASATTLQTVSSQGKAGQWTRAQLSQNGRILVAGNEEQVQLFDMASGKGLWKRALKSNGGMRPEQFWTFALSPDGEKLAVAICSGNREGVFPPGEGIGNRGRLWLYGIHNGHLSRISTGDRAGEISYEEAPSAVSFSPQGDNLALGFEYLPLALWNLKKRDYLWSPVPGFNPASSPAWTLAFSPDGQTLAVSTRRGGTSLWNVSTGVCKFSLKNLNARSELLSFSRDGHTLATNDGNGAIHLWNVGNGKLTRTLSAGFAVSALAFSPDSSHLAVGTSDGQVQLWRVK